jgi:hypothetical protein
VVPRSDWSKRWCNHSGQSHWNRCSSPSSGLAQRNCSRDDGDCPGQGPDEIEREGRVECDHGAGRCPQLRRRATKRGIVQLAEEGWNEARSRPANCAAGGHGRRPGAANCRPVALREITAGFSAEFADRPFLGISPGHVPATLQVWTGDEPYHLRRLRSQGTRPRLSWAQRLMLPPRCRHPAPRPALREPHALHHPMGGQPR